MVDKIMDNRNIENITPENEYIEINDSVRYDILNNKMNVKPYQIKNTPENADIILHIIDNERFRKREKKIKNTESLYLSK